MATDTRERILQSAEKLFVCNGFEGTSLRAITAEAEVNLAAVNYHFGSKERLLEEMLRARIAPLNAERLRRLDALEAELGPQGASLEQYLDAFLRPAIESFRGADRHQMVGLVGLMFCDRLGRGFFGELFREVMQRFQCLRDALPGLGDEEFAWRFHFMIGAMIHAATHQLEDRDPRLGKPDDDTFLDLIICWAAAGFRAEAALASPKGSAS